MVRDVWNTLYVRQTKDENEWFQTKIRAKNYMKHFIYSSDVSTFTHLSRINRIIFLE